MAQRGYKILKQWRWQDLFSRDFQCIKNIHDTVVHKVYPARNLAKSSIVPETTLYWLVHPWLDKECSKLEASGYMSEIVAWIGEDTNRKKEWRELNRQAGIERWDLLKQQDKDLFDQKGWTKRFKAAGIGGIRGWDHSNEPGSPKCLHLHYAHYLSNQTKENCNLIGKQIHFKLLELHKSEC